MFDTLAGKTVVITTNVTREEQEIVSDILAGKTVVMTTIFT